MTIDQRNNGAAITVNSATEFFAVDRINNFGSTSAGVYTAQRSTVAPPGFTNSLLCTITTTSTPSGGQEYGIRQSIEGFNIADLAWGTANAQPITLSFWVRSSITGTFAGSVASGVYDRSYVFTYTINAANTWEQKSVTIPGDTTGTWPTNNNAGMRFQLNLGAGSAKTGTPGVWGAGYIQSATGSVNLIQNSGATFQTTGWQIEEGTAASPFENRLITTELSLCQRYFYMVADGAAKSLGLGTMYTSTQLQGAVFFPVTMRATPTLSATTGSAYYEFIRNGTSDGFNSLSLGNRTSTTVGEIENNSDVSGTVGWSGFIRTDNAATKVGFSAEL
jgi:hypothetical protein